MIKLKSKNENLSGARRDAAAAAKNQAGFTMPELLVAVAVFLIVTGAMFGLMEITRIDRNRASRRSDTLKNARAAIHLIGRDALNAGLSYNRTGGSAPEAFLATRLGIPQDVNNTRDSLTSIVSGNDINGNLLLPNNGKTDVIAFAYRDMEFNDSNKIALNGAQAASGAPNVVSVNANGSTITTDATKIQPAKNDLYLVETADGKQVAVMATKVDLTNKKIEFAPGDPLGINQSLTGSGENGSLLKPCDPPNGVTEHCTVYVALLKRFFWVSYKINAEGTLIRTVFGNNRGGTVAADQIQEQPLAYGIQNMQIKYVLEDGTVTDDPVAGPDKIAGTNDDTPFKLNEVRQITVTLRVQSNESDEQTKKPEIISITATFSTRNLEYDAG